MGCAKALGRAGDEDEGDVGEFLTEDRELGEEVAANAAGSWAVSDYIGEVLSLMLEHKSCSELKNYYCTCC